MSRVLVVDDEPQILRALQINLRVRGYQVDTAATGTVTKPFNVDELLARMRAAVRRAAPAGSAPQVKLGDLAVDLAAKRVTRPDGSDVRLTPPEWHLLEILLRR